jgi:hypothetical protein
MKKIKLIAGITWAILGLILIIALFPGLNSSSAAVARLPFMKINPNYTGGEIGQQFITASCTLDIRKPVFDGLLMERKKGFVQLDWRGNIPDKIFDTIDYDLDKIPDFSISIDRNEPKTVLVPINSKVREISISTSTSYGWSVRVELIK